MISKKKQQAKNGISDNDIGINRGAHMNSA